MNNPTDRFQDSSGASPDSLIDALLSEHARLGTHDDVGLLATVRARTIAIPAPLPFPEPKTRSFSRADLWKVAALVAAVLALLGVVVSRIETSGPKSDSLHLVLRPVSFSIGIDREDSGPETAWRTRPPRVPLADPASLSQVDFLPAGAGSLSLSYRPAWPQEEIPADRYEFDQLASLMLPSTELLAQVSVAADRTIREEDNQTLIYEGRVQLAHPEFRLTADRLEFSKPTESGEDCFGSFLASGDAVRVEKRSPGGALQVAEGLRVSYHADGGALVLWGGPPRLQSGDSRISPDSLDGAIVLRQDGFQVIESAALDGPIRR